MYCGAKGAKSQAPGQGASEVMQGEPEPQEQPLDDGHNAEVEEMEMAEVDHNFNTSKN